MSGARFPNGVKVAESPSQTTVPVTRLEIFGSANSLKVARLIVLQRAGWLKVTKTVVPRSTFCSPGVGFEETTLNCSDGRACASTPCAPTRPATHKASDNMMSDILLMTLSFNTPDARQTEASTASPKGIRRPGQCESAQCFKRKVRAPSAFARCLSGVIEGMSS